MLDIFTPVFIVSDPSQDIADSGNVVRVMAIQKYRKQRGNIFAVVQQKSSINHLKVAKDHGFIPVVDMENYTTVYNEREKVCNTFNAWEYYFEQV